LFVDAPRGEVGGKGGAVQEASDDEDDSAFIPSSSCFRSSFFSTGSISIVVSGARPLTRALLPSATGSLLLPGDSSSPLSRSPAAISTDRWNRCTTAP